MITALIVFLIWFALACALGLLVGRALRARPARGPSAARIQRKLPEVDDDFH